MWEMPKIKSSDAEVVATEVEFRRRTQGGMDRGDWYVTWATRSRPWEVSIMRLSRSDNAGRAWHHGRFVDYEVHWRWSDAEHDRRVHGGSVLPLHAWGV